MDEPTRGSLIALAHHAPRADKRVHARMNPLALTMGDPGRHRRGTHAARLGRRCVTRGPAASSRWTIRTGWTPCPRPRPDRAGRRVASPIEAVGDVRDALPVLPVRLAVPARPGRSRTCQRRRRGGFDRAGHRSGPDRRRSRRRGHQPDQQGRTVRRRAFPTPATPSSSPR